MFSSLLVCDFCLVLEDMFRKSTILAASLAILGATATPAGPGNPAYTDTANKRVYKASNDTMGIYGLLEVYDAGNWFDKFNVEAVRTNHII